MKMYYLELNPFIVAGKKLLCLDLSGCYAYTSSWAISEQIINIRETNFDKIKASFHLINNLDIKIDWENTMDKMLTAFNVPKKHTEISMIIKIVFQNIIDCKTYHEINIEYIAFINEIKKMRESFSGIQKIYNNFFKKYNGPLSNNINPQENIRILFFDILLTYVAANSVYSKEILIERYTGKLDRYINAQSKYFYKNYNVKKNDFVDMEHFKYIQNDITYMVSDDKIMSAVDNGKTINVNDFLEKYKKGT